MITIERNPLNYTFDAVVNHTSIDGKLSTATFTFKYLSEKERKDKTGEELIKSAVAGWKDINFSDGTPFTFSTENLDLVLTNELLASAILSTYMYELNQAIEKNLKKSS